MANFELIHHSNQFKTSKQTNIQDNDTKRKQKKPETDSNPSKSLQWISRPNRIKLPSILQNWNPATESMTNSLTMAISSWPKFPKKRRKESRPGNSLIGDSRDSLPSFPEFPKYYLGILDDSLPTRRAFINMRTLSMFRFWIGCSVGLFFPFFFFFFFFLYGRWGGGREVVKGWCSIQGKPKLASQQK